MNDGNYNIELCPGLNYIERRFQVRVENVFIRPLGNVFSAQIHVELDRNMQLEKAHAILTDIRNSIAERFNIEETVVIPRPV